jgi:DNA-binding NarL/FixJ family response regulator
MWSKKTIQKTPCQWFNQGMDRSHILLIDDHALFRAGLGMVIHRALPDAAIHQAASVAEALETAPASLQLVLLDIKLKGSSGLESIGLVKRQWPDVPVLMLSSLDEPETTRVALARGAAAFVSKAETPEKIIEVIGQLLSGQAEPPDPAAGNRDKHLTPRQREVLEFLHQGLTNKLIARKLALSDNTVRRHMQEILKYFGVATRAEAVYAARLQALVG